MKYLFSITLLFLLFSCGEEEKVEKPDVNWTKHDSTNMGREIAIQEEIDIKLFLELHKDWSLTKTGSGLRYEIYDPGEADTSSYPMSSDWARIQYSISLLDGTVCYDVEGDEVEEFAVDNSEIESGFQELIKKMTVGDKARAIIPSHLGHGLLGDMDKIPPLNTLVVDIELLEIIKK